MPSASVTLLVVTVIFSTTGAGAAAQLPVFEVASVRANATNAPATSRFPLGPGDAYVPGTVFAATNQPLVAYIRFAFGRSQEEVLRLPSWVYDDRFDIQGRGTGEPTKDDMRLMVRALLRERFGLVWHTEPHEEAVLELVVARASETGPRLKRHGDDQPCGAGAPADRSGAFDSIPCGSGLVATGSPDRVRIDGRAEPITRLAALLSRSRSAGVDRAVVDRTGLAGNFDFVLEWAVPADLANASARSLSDGTPPLADALRQQLGLTLRPAKAVVDAFVVDHIERPSGN